MTLRSAVTAINHHLELTDEDKVTPKEVCQAVAEFCEAKNIDPIAFMNYTMTWIAKPETKEGN